MNFFVNTCSNFNVNSSLEVKVLNMWTNTRVQLLGNFGRGNQIYMNFGDHFPTQKCRNHCLRNPNDAPETPSLRPQTFQISGNGIIQGGSDPGFYTRRGP